MSSGGYFFQWRAKSLLYLEIFISCLLSVWGFPFNSIRWTVAKFQFFDDRMGRFPILSCSYMILEVLASKTFYRENVLVKHSTRWLVMKVAGELEEWLGKKKGYNFYYQRQQQKNNKMWMLGLAFWGNLKALSDSRMPSGCCSHIDLQRVIYLVI